MLRCNKDEELDGARYSLIVFQYFIASAYGVRNEFQSIVHHENRNIQIVDTRSRVQPSSNTITCAQATLRKYKLGQPSICLALNP